MPKAIEIVLPFLKHWEGCRLKSYMDQAGRITVGWGHVIGGQVGLEWSQEQADNQLLLDTEEMLKRVVALVKAPVNDNQLAALTSFVYNLGPSNLSRSGLLKLLNLQKYAQAADQFPLWCHIGMYMSQGLLARRNAERDLFLTEVV